MRLIDGKGTAEELKGTCLLMMRPAVLSVRTSMSPFGCPYSQHPQAFPHTLVLLVIQIQAFLVMYTLSLHEFHNLEVIASNGKRSEVIVEVD